MTSAIASLGHVPRFIQRTILYDLSWRFKTLINHPEKLGVLSELQYADFKSLISKIFEHIDVETIRTGNFGCLVEEYKIAILEIYKQVGRVNDFIYIKEFDDVNQQHQLAYYCGKSSDKNVQIYIDGYAAEPSYPSQTITSFCNKPFYTERRFWITAKAGEISATIDGRPARIKRGGQLLGDRVSTRQLRAAYVPTQATNLPEAALELRKFCKQSEVKNKYNGCWVFMDRADRADDNAEHLYRYMKSIRSDKDMYFILRQDCRKWLRLEGEGFSLLAYGSDEHVAAMVHASILASSHADQFILSPVDMSWIRDLIKYKFVFLQHGITKDDLSKWLNTKPISLFVTATPNEFNSIADPTSQYKFSTKETKLTGFPRHDALKNAKRSKETLLIMPTWRRYLLGGQTSVGWRHDRIEQFEQTTYAKAWASLLKQPKLHALAEQHGVDIVFRPHHTMTMYLDSLDLPDYVRCIRPEDDESMQATFAKASVLITDYSSVAMECAYIDKPIVYYQFDKAEFFSGNHVYSKGYFDYESDGFGPVCQQENEVLSAIENALLGKEDAKYAHRRNNFFPQRDGRNCERVYHAMLEMLGEEVIGLQKKANASVHEHV